jgi:hypothetical protein
MRRGATLAALLLAAACTSQRAATPPAIEFLAFGDGGYHYDYLEADAGEGLMTPEAFTEAERLDWLGDKRPPAEFKPPPAYLRPDTGGYVLASGQAAVATAMRRWCDGPPACEFAVMLGDNIYPNGATGGADGRSDAERFRKVLFEPYSPLAATTPRFRIYAALGNHDWRTSREAAMAQVRYLEQTPPFYMDGIRYRVAPTGDPRGSRFSCSTRTSCSRASPCSRTSSPTTAASCTPRKWTRPTTGRSRRTTSSAAWWTGSRRASPNRRRGGRS